MIVEDNHKFFYLKDLINTIIGFVIIFALICVVELPALKSFLFIGVESVNIHDEALGEGLPIVDNGSYSQSFTVEKSDLSKICLELTSEADTIANFSISLYGEESEAVSSIEFDELETKDHFKYYWNLDDVGLIVGETAVLSIFMGSSEGGNNPIIHSIEYFYGMSKLSAIRLAILIITMALLVLTCSLIYSKFTQSRTSGMNSSDSQDLAQKGSSRIVYFEIMRVLACLLVIYNHLPIYGQFMTTENGPRTLYMTQVMITRVNVPIFFMVSGALLLHKNEDFITVFRKRFLRIIVLLAFFYLIIIAASQYGMFLKGSQYDISIRKFLLGFISRELPWSDAYWYLYAYLGYLFMLPLLQRLAKGITRAEVTALIILHFITSSLLPMINLFFMKNGIEENIRIDGNFNVPFAFVQALFYPIMGYYLEHKVDIRKVKVWHICVLMTGAIIGITLSNICTYADAELNGAFSQNYVMLFDYLTAIAVFMLIKFLYTKIKADRKPGIIGNVISFVGSMTLGIYMLDPIFKEILYPGLCDKTPSFSVTGQGILWILVSMTLGTACTFLLKKNILFRKLL